MAQHSWLNNQCTLLLGGESLSHQTVDSIYSEVINEYGPTETCVGCSVYKINGDESLSDECKADISNHVPIGKAIGNMQIYVLNENLLPVPVGVQGQICIGGAGLAQGYVNQPGLTAKKFVPNPFSKVPGERLYLSGDVGIVCADGNVLCVGRQDQQVKINGFRIELEEVASVATQHKTVSNSAAVVVSHNGQSSIVLFVIPDIRLPFEQQSLLDYLADYLPSYMIPKDIMTLDVMPLTGSGKLDRTALLGIWQTHNEQNVTNLVSQIESLSDEEVEKLLNDSSFLEQGVS